MGEPSRKNIEMYQLKFEEEFTQFLCRWMEPITNEDGTTSPPLTNEELGSAIQNVQQVLFGAVPPTPDYSSVKTPATGIAVCTPSAPNIQKPNMDSPTASLGRYRSLDTLMTEDKDATNIVEEFASKSQEDMDVDENTGSDATIEDTKMISRSTPAIHVTKAGKSDTFIREQQNSSRPFNENDASMIELRRILKKIDELRECANNVVTRIDDVKKDVCPQSTKPIRRLSSIGGLSRTSTLVRPLPPTKMRRSSSGIPGTPTSSKLNSTIEKSMKTEKSTISTKRSSMAVVSTSRSPNSNGPQKSTATATATVIMKKSPCTTKNPKYAHVQSTIPKSTTTKRKAAQ